MILYTLKDNQFVDLASLDSLEDAHVYVNLTNRCPCACTFCLRQTKVMSESHTLWLKEEPTVDEIMKEFQKYDLDDFSEVVFCGFGEPLERVDEVIRSRFGIESFQAMLDFAKKCKAYVPHVILSVVDIIGEDKIKRCQKICDDLNVTLRVRPFEE